MSEQGELHRLPEKFAMVSLELIHNTGLTDGAVRLYAHMLWRYGKNHNNHEGLESMASCLDVSEATISKRIKELEAHNWVVTVERDFNPNTGNYQTPYYHVFMQCEDCQKFRESYKPLENERVCPKPTIEVRKSRKGIGGKPAHKPKQEETPLNSSLPGKLELTGAANSSFANTNALDLNASVVVSTAPETETVYSAYEKRYSILFPNLRDTLEDWKKEYGVLEVETVLGIVATTETPVTRPKRYTEVILAKRHAASPTLKPTLTIVSTPPKSAQSTEEPRRSNYLTFKKKASTDESEDASA